MVDLPSRYSPPSPLEVPVLGSPLCGDLIRDIDDLQDLSQSIEDDALSSFDVPEYQSSGPGSGSDSSTVIGMNSRLHVGTTVMSCWKMVVYNHRFKAHGEAMVQYEVVVDWSVMGHQLYQSVKFIQ